MSSEPETRTEVLPGYRLIEMIGRGGFGEVWKVEAPGGLLKACKFIHGRIVAGDDASGAKVHRELKGLEQLKAVRHPFILSLERFDIVDGQLVVIMELADRDLEHRLREVKEAGLVGIPRGELLRYILEIAEALDVMNIDYDVQHLDIKPSNIFLVRGHVKVADFGLSKGLQGRVGRISGGITPIYAAPETFDGWVSRHTDQYSLAILYQEMLTGTRPFPGPSPRQLMVQHMTAEPDLSTLPECDRPIVSKSLSKKPDNRFENCTKFAEALLAAEAGGIDNLLQAARMSVGMNVFAGPPASTAAGVAEKETVEGVAAKISTVSIPKLVLPPRPAIGVPRPIGQGLPAAAESPTAALGRIQVTRALPRLPTMRIPTRAIENRPTLVVGLGKFGGKVIERIQKKLLLRNPMGTSGACRLLWMDSEDAKDRMSATVAVRRGDLADFHVPCPIPSHLRTSNPGNSAEWAGQRRMGRAAFIANLAAVRHRLRLELGNLSAGQPIAPGDPFLVPSAIFVAAMGGGAGGGMLIDAAYQTRQIARSLGIARMDVEFILVAGITRNDPRQDRRRINHLALLDDLRRFLPANARHQVDTEVGVEEVVGPVASTLYLLDGGIDEDRPETAARLVGSVADFVVESFSPRFGRPLLEAAGNQHWPAFRSFGFASLIDAELRTTRAVAARLCEQVFTDWSAPLTEADVVRIGRGIGERWYAANVAAAQVVAELRAAANDRFGRNIDAAIAQTIHLVETGLAHDPGSDLRDWTRSAVNRLRHLLDPEAEADKALSWVGSLEASRSAVVAAIRQRLESIVDEVAAGMSARLSAIEAARSHLSGILDQFAAESENRRLAAQKKLETAIEALQFAIVRSGSVAVGAGQKSFMGRLRQKSGGSALPPAIAEFSADFSAKLLHHATAFIEERLERCTCDCYREIADRWKEHAAKARHRGAQIQLFAATLGSSTGQLDLPAVFEVTTAASFEQAIDSRFREIVNEGLEPFEKLLDATIEQSGGLQATLDRFDREGPVAASSILETTEKYVLNKLGSGDSASRFAEWCIADPPAAKTALSRLVERAMPGIAAGPGLHQAAFLSGGSPAALEKIASLLQELCGIAPTICPGAFDVELLQITAGPQLESFTPRWVAEAKPEYDAAMRSNDPPALFPAF